MKLRHEPPITADLDDFTNAFMKMYWSYDWDAEDLDRDEVMEWLRVFGEANYAAGYVQALKEDTTDA